MGAPYVTDVSPPSELALAEALTFTLLDSVDFRRVVVAIYYPGLRFVELVWAGANPGGATAGEFSPPYARVSSAVNVVDGSDFGTIFTIRRAPVWPDAPELRVYAVDVEGDEV